jgi:hypothetical protein
MLWFAVEAPVPATIAWPISTLGFATVGVVVATVLVGLAAYKTFSRKPAARPDLQLAERKQNTLRLKPA